MIEINEQAVAAPEQEPAVGANPAAVEGNIQRGREADTTVQAPSGSRPTDMVRFFGHQNGEVLYTSTILRYLSHDYDVDPNAYTLALHQARLAGVDITTIDFTDWDFSDCNLRDANFTGCRLHSTSWRGTDIRNANFTHADLRDSCFDGAIAQDAYFTHADLNGASFSGVCASRMIGVELWGYLDTGYLLYTYRTPAGLLILRAGCRKFTLRQAQYHWRDRHDRPLIRIALALIDRAAVEQEWRTEATADEVNDD